MIILFMERVEIEWESFTKSLKSSGCNVYFKIEKKIKRPKRLYYLWKGSRSNENRLQNYWNRAVITFISRSKGKKKIETIILFMERNTRRSENDHDSLTFREDISIDRIAPLIVFSTDVVGTGRRKTRNDDDRPIIGKTYPSSNHFIHSCSFRFFFPLSFSFLRATRRKHIDRKGNDLQVQRFRFENIHGRKFCDCV